MLERRGKAGGGQLRCGGAASKHEKGGRTRKERGDEVGRHASKSSKSKRTVLSRGSGREKQVPKKAAVQMEPDHRLGRVAPDERGRQCNTYQVWWKYKRGDQTPQKAGPKEKRETETIAYVLDLTEKPFRGSESSGL